MKTLIASDSAESSVMQTIAIAVSAILAGSTGTFASQAVFAGLAIGETNWDTSRNTIAASYLNRELGSALEVTEATPHHITVLTTENECISYSIELDDDFATTLVRIFGGCDDSDFLPNRDVLLDNLTPDSAFEFSNIAGLSIVSGSPVGDCSSFFIPVECDSTIPNVIRLVATTTSPLGKHALNVSVPTEAVELTMLVSGDDDVFAATESI